MSKTECSITYGKQVFSLETWQAGSRSSANTQSQIRISTNEEPEDRGKPYINKQGELVHEKIDKDKCMTFKEATMFVEFMELIEKRSW